jgi:hypothetical protein
MGGTVDPKTGEVVWDFHVPLADQPAHYAAHPPSALAPVRATAIELPDHPFDGHGEPVNVAFAVSCPCGGKQFVALGYWSDDEERFTSPITLECATCETLHEIFDIRMHGFDGAVGNNRSLEPPPPETIDAIPCELDEPYEVIVRFEFPSDHLGDPDLDADASDLFSWITVVGRDAESQRLVTLFEDECA